MNYQPLVGSSAREKEKGVHKIFGFRKGTR